MPEEALQIEGELSSHSKEVLRGSEVVSPSAEITEEFYRIRAIQEGGLPVEIVGLVPSVTYQRKMVSINRGLMELSRFWEESEEVGSDMFDVDSSTVNFFGVGVNVTFKIFFQTPYCQVYRGSVPDTVATAVLEGVDSSRGMEKIGDICRRRSVEAMYHPDDTMESGELTVGGEGAEVQCDTIDFVQSASEKEDRIARFFANCSRDVTVSSMWNQSYVSDVRHRDGTVFFVVETALGQAVFPYVLSHDEDSVFWEFVENHGGGSLSALRGKNVCIRLRGPAVEEFNKKSMWKTNERSAQYDLRGVEQAVATPNRYDETALIDGPSDVIPVGVDADYVWTLGYPEESASTDDENSTDCNGFFSALIDSIT